MEDGSVITFYSFKGGTGRTMALANCGVELARKTRGDVLMVDWHLEAPGLHEFFPKTVHDGSLGPTPSCGVLELFERAAEHTTGASELSRKEGRRFWGEFDLDDYIVPTEEASLSLLPAGRLDREYGSRVSTLPWRDLFERWSDLFTTFAERLSARYRYVLIDSRTGVTDSSGICTMLLPDRLVVVFNSNRQSLSGGLEQARRATEYRGGSADLRPLLVFPLVSRVEMSEDKLRRQWRYGTSEVPGYQPEFEQLFKDVYGLPECDLEQYFDEIQIQHAGRYAYGESIAVRDEPSDRLSLSRSYQRFTRALLAPGGPWLFEATSRTSETTGFEADQALDLVDDLIRLHRRRARWARLLDTAAFVVTGLALAIAIFFFATGDAFNETGIPSTRFIVSAVIGAALVELGRRSFALDSLHRSHAGAATALLREYSLFLANGRPYATAVDPAAVLIERATEIDREAAYAVRRTRPARVFPPGKDDGG